MFFRKLKKIPAIFLVCALLFTTIFSYSMIANASSTFTPRFDAPSYDNSYYYSNKNIYYQYGYGMPNCTAYAYGRAYEILGEDPGLCHYDAYKWYDYDDGYSRGQTPKVGAIACWKYYRNGEWSGHVAVVEQIENGVVTFSNSAWGWLEFYLSHADVDDPTMGESDWTFQGFIYLDDFKTNPDDDKKDDDISSYQLGKYQVEVSDSLNMRSQPTTSSSTVGQLYNGNIVNVTEVKKSGGYVWGYTSHNGRSGWIALDYCKYVGNDSSYELGDINMDGNLTVADITALQLYISGDIELSDEQFALADIDGNGKINVGDVTALQDIVSNQE